MGLGNRPYWREGEDQAGGLRMATGLPRPTTAVKWLLIANGAVYVLQLLFDQNLAFSAWGGMTVNGWWQPWRYVTCQFMHSPSDPWHIVMNMLGLYFLGTALEQLWGTRRFIRFYLTCGVIAALAYVVVGGLGDLNRDRPIIGASGAVFGLLMAAAILLPHFQIILLFFPVPIRLAAVIIFGIMVFGVIRALSIGATGSAMSDVAHLGGAVAAAVWLLAGPRLKESFTFYGRSRRQGAWERKMAQRRADQEEIDRILAKIHDQGLNSLTSKEKRILQEASRRQQKEDHDLTRL